MLIASHIKKRFVRIMVAVTGVEGKSQHNVLLVRDFLLVPATALKKAFGES